MYHYHQDNRRVKYEIHRRGMPIPSSDYYSYHNNTNYYYGGTHPIYYHVSNPNEPVILSQEYVNPVQTVETLNYENVAPIHVGYPTYWPY